MIITATWLPDTYGYRLDATGNVGTPTWYRSAYWPDGRFRNHSIGTGLPRYDLNVPLDGATVIYTAVDGADVAETAPLNPTSALPILGLHDRPGVPAAEVVIESFREQTVTARTVYYDILDRNEPFVQTMPPSERRGRMVLRMDHPGGPWPGRMLDRTRKMLRTGEMMTLRTTCNDRVESLIPFIFETWTEAQVGEENRHGPDRRITIDWRTTDSMFADVQTSGRVWALVPKEFATWTEVVAEVPTWQDLVDG